MPELKCTVATCVHNVCNCCDLGHIDIGGDQALSQVETCCNSFADSSMTSYSNSAKATTVTSDIHCNATNCQYNQNCNCEAGTVEVKGNNACQCCETECASFCKCAC